jgi:hypothetical protein
MAVSDGTFEMQCQECGAVRRTSPAASSVQIDRCSCGAFNWCSPIIGRTIGTTGHLALAHPQDAVIVPGA